MYSNTDVYRVNKGMQMIVRLMNACLPKCYKLIDSHVPLCVFLTVLADFTIQ